MAETSFPIAQDIWFQLQTLLSNQAKRLVEDIAKKQGVESKELWGLVKPQIRIGLLDIEIPEDIPTYCSHMKGHAEHGAVRMRCRAPCVLGFPACPDHTGKPDVSLGAATESLPQVRRVFDLDHKVYFVDDDQIARDRNGVPKGTVDAEGVLHLFEVWKGPPKDSTKVGT